MVATARRRVPAGWRAGRTGRVGGPSFCCHDPRGHLPATGGNVRRALACVVSVLLATGGAAACSGSAGDRSASGATPLRSCAEVACAGEIDGAPYRIELPRQWNGTLVIWSHGYRQVRPAPPDYAPVRHDAEVAKQADGPGDRRYADALLAEGYALAGSAYRTNGWAVADGVRAAEQLHDFFVRAVGRPRRTYLWGESLGGLITQAVAERHPDWVSGAVPTCGVLAGPVQSFDLVLDGAFAIKTLLLPSLKLQGYASFDAAVRAFDTAIAAIHKAAADPKDGVPKLLVVAALVDPSSKTSDLDGHDPASRFNAQVTSVATSLWFGTVARWELERRAGGPISGNAGVDYAIRVDPAERAQIDSLAPGRLDGWLRQLAAAPRLRADPAARAGAVSFGDPTGRLTVPTVTLHTGYDDLVSVQEESVFADRVERAGRTDRLMQLYTTPPPRYSDAPYGAGHCNFTVTEETGAI
ncbi:MAG TPA: hypothetical protein VKP11_00385, partial [Frankiaceae bacterium]|nr:hypothetical protein [Frankiaceae bacterium]